jgi:hypothetical protein
MARPAVRNPADAGIGIHTSIPPPLANERRVVTAWAITKPRNEGAEWAHVD